MLLAYNFRGNRSLNMTVTQLVLHSELFHAADVLCVNSSARSSWPRPLLLFGLLVCGFVLLSFAPFEVKAMLHTRGPLHAAAHMACFAVLQLSLCACFESSSKRRWSCLALGCLALLVEEGQTQGSWRYLEVQDVALDAFGIAVALALLQLRDTRQNT